MRTFTILMCILLLSTAALLGQQDIYLKGGISLPVKPHMFTDNWKSGAAVGAGMGWNIFPYASIGFMIEMNSFSFDEFSQSAVFNHLGLTDTIRMHISGDQSVISSFNLIGKIFPIPIEDAATITPYIICGMNYLLISKSDIKITYSGKEYTLKSKPQSSFGVIAGLGVDFAISNNLGLFIEGKYIKDIKNYDYRSYVPLEAGIRITN